MERREAIVTKHAETRIRDRVGIPKRAVARHAEMALGNGRSWREIRGRVGEYARRLYFRYGIADNLRVYRGNVYLFHGNVLITVVNIPKSIQNHKSGRIAK